MSTIQKFEDLQVWKEGHLLVIATYLATKSFPKDELFSLTNQIRRSAVSITSNIAEGFGRETYKDKAHFYQISLGSILELQNQFLIAKDIGYMEEAKFCEIIQQVKKVEMLCRGLIKKSRTFYS
jgi:four helix bundle protein